MESIRKWFYRPKRDDTSLLAQFFYADESLNAVACELDSFDGRQEPERCTTLVNQLRHCQDKVLTICNQIMDDLIPESRANRDFRVKFPDDVMQENLAGQLWFGAECLTAGSSIMNREAESSAMRPLAKALTKSLEIVRNLLREHALKGHMNLKAQNPLEPSFEKLIESLKIFDRLFADFELCYVGAMVPVKSTKEYEQQELVCVLFSETLQRALERGLLNQADVDNYEPALMFTIPRLAIVAGLLAPPGGPLCLNSPDTISEMFRPFRNLLLKIRELLWTLNNRELYMLEKLLCSNEEPTAPIAQTSSKSICQEIPDVDEFVHNFYTDYPNCKDFIVDFYTVTRNTGTNMDEIANDAAQMLDDDRNRMDYLIDRRSKTEREKKRLREKKMRNNNRDTKVDSNSLISSEKKISTSRETKNHERIKNSQKLSSMENSCKLDLESSSEQNQSSNNVVSAMKNVNRDVNQPETSTRRRTEFLENQETENSKIKSESPENDDSDSRRQIDNYMSPDISQILGTTGHMEIPQTQYLLNQVSHENNQTHEQLNIENSLPDLDSHKLINEANKTLSNLLLEDDCQNEISEQTDSGICTVVSSENTSLYDKSPEEKKLFPNDDEKSNNEETIAFDGHEEENTSYSCSNVNSPKRKNSSTTSTSSCVCNLRTTKNLTTMENNLELSNENNSDGKIPSTMISSNFNGTNEEFLGVAYGNGQLTVCDANQPSFQINYSENWENLNLKIDRQTSSSKREFWNDLNCKNCPSTSGRVIEKIGSNIERYAHERTLARRAKDVKLKKRHQRKFDRRLGKKNHEDVHRSWSCNVRDMRLSQQLQLQQQQMQSSESSRSNSNERFLQSRFASFGASLHPSQNTRQMPNFGSHSPQPSPRLCHFESRSSDNNSATSFAERSTNSRGYGNSASNNRKLLDHRRSRFEKIARMKKKCVGEDFGGVEVDDSETRDLRMLGGDERSSEDSMNDGLGPRTDRSGLVNERSPSPTDFRDFTTTRTSRGASRGGKLVNPRVIVRVNASMGRRNGAVQAASSSSCSSCCDSSSETSEFQSDCQDDEEIALAMQAAEIANRNEIRAKFRSSEDLVHRLFVCIAGVADQLQTNFASDLRNILKCVFLMNSSQTVEVSETIDDAPEEPPVTPVDVQSPASTEIINTSENVERQNSLPEDDEEFEETTPTNERNSPITECGEECVERAPAWVPDNDAPRCMACHAGFTVVRRRHHCRNCGKVFCGRCSSNNVPLPRYGHTKPVRVCNRCFLYQVTPFTVAQLPTTS